MEQNLSFKTTFKKFIGIKTVEEINKEKTTKEKVIDFISSITFALITAFLIITFIIQNTRIPTGSMEDTILVGDFVLVNKFIYGSLSPRYIPFTEIELPNFTLPALKEPKANDIVVFEYPGEKDRLFARERNVNYVKRCIGTPGDTIKIINRVVYINGKEFRRPPHIKYLNYYSRQAGNIEPRIFPQGAPWNEDNYGPLVVPKKNSTINLNMNNIEQWRTIIDREYGKRVVKVENNIISIDGKPTNSYTFKKDYFFMMGDNRNDSLDSRFWGFVARDTIIGEAFITLFSWNRDIPFTQIFKLIGSIRPDRILKLLH
ncbi:MAG: signal peptidase I [Ignavibacteriales bacterium CG_4_9_14_3_um_filter_30_11]|nr:MAG: signal peptidase I [Ignavibacteriales bacterium CG_4_9_14_3_um_filter_30_11]